MSRPTHEFATFGLRLWRPFHLEAGKLHVELGGMSVKRGPFWLPDGLHFWWGRRYLSMWWSEGAKDSPLTSHIERGVLPTIPEPAPRRPS